MLGTSFKIKTDEDPEYVKKVLALYKNKIEHIQTTMDIREPVKVAILSGIMLADELVQKEQEFIKKESTEKDEISKITTRLIDTIDKALS